MKWRERTYQDGFRYRTEWKARKRHCDSTVQAVRGQGYYFLIKHKPTNEQFNSLWQHAPYPSVESAQQAAEQAINLFITKGAWYA